MSDAIKNTQINGDVSVGHNVSVGGDMTIQGKSHFKGNVRIDGWFDAKNIKVPNKGLFQTEALLCMTYSAPRTGWWALVGDSLPAQVYVAIDGKWLATGKMSGELTLDVEQYNEVVTALREKITIILDSINGIRNDITELAGDIGRNSESIIHLQEYLDGARDDIIGLGDNLDLPYRFLPGWDTPRPGDFSDWKLVAQSLDKLNGGSENSNLSGWYRGSVQGVPFDVRVFVRSYIDNEWTQIIAGPVATDHLGRLSIGAQFTILKRNCHNGGWSSWIDDTAAVSTLQNSLAAETKERRDGDNKIQHGIDELEERFSELLPQLSSGVRYVAPAMAPANTIFETKENFLLRELDDGKYTTVRELTLDGKGYIAWSHTVGAGEPAADDSMTLLVIGNDGEPECHTAPLPDSLLELPMAVGENTEKLARIERELNRLLDKTVSALGFSSVGAGLYILDGELNVRTIPPEELAPILT